VIVVSAVTIVVLAVCVIHFWVMDINVVWAKVNRWFLP
jgi:hypothetical protein